MRCIWASSVGDQTRFVLVAERALVARLADPGDDDIERVAVRKLRFEEWPRFGLFRSVKLLQHAIPVLTDNKNFELLHEVDARRKDSLVGGVHGWSWQVNIVEMPHVE